MIESETDPVLRQYLLLGYFSHTSPGPEDSSLAQRALAEIPPTSIVWSLQSGGASITLPTISHLAKQPEMAQVYADSIIEAHPDRTVRASFLFSQVMNASRALENQQQRTPDPNVQAASSDTTRFARLLDRLVSEYGDTPWAEFARKFFPRERNVLPGREVPDFTVVSLDDSTVTLTRQSLRGRVYLMDFWAVWCGPCVAEMPFLHAAHARFKDRGFTILSLSFDKHRLDVRDYRQATWPMPWLHGFVDGGSESDLAMRFEVAGIPRSILVDRDGTIRATELRGKKLEETLAAMFEQQSPPTH
jgi:thiol-disulfide isomerase/thioredoxin